MRRDRHIRIVLVICSLLVTPILASASWWNPVSWFGGWFGIFDSYATTATTTPEIETDESSSGGLSGFFTRAKPKKDPGTQSPPPQTPPPRGKTPFWSNPTKPAVSPVNSSGGTPSRTTTPNGVVWFSEEIQVPRRTAGVATSSNIMHIRFPATTTRMTIKQVASKGITFKTGTCKITPCSVANIVSVTSAVAEGRYPVTVTVTSGTSTAVGMFTVVVLPPESLEVQMTVSGPITVHKKSDGSVSGSNILTIQLLRGTPQKLTLTHGDFPDGVTGRTDLGSCMPPCTIRNNMTISSDTESGRHPMVIRASGDGVSRSVGYDLNVGYSSKFGLHFDGEVRTYTQNYNPTASIIMDYPFDLLLDGGTPETAVLSFSSPNASTTATFSRPSCLLPCMGLNAHIEMLPGMKPNTTHTTKLTATVFRQEEDGRGGMKTIKYTETRNIKLKIIPLLLPY